MKTLMFEYESQIALESSITRAIQREIDRLALAIHLSRNVLTKFEQQYHLPSDEFFEKMECGELGDSSDFIEWAGEYELLQRTEQRLLGLQGMRICS